MSTLTENITVGNFRTFFVPFFDNIDTYPNSKIQQTLDGVRETDISCESLWGSLYGYAVYNLTAHKLYLYALQLQQTAGGALIAGGNNIGALNSATVGDISVSWDAVNMADDDQGYWGALPSTKYGQEFIRLSKKIRAGGLLANKFVIN